MEWKAVRYEAGDGVGLITLNRPHPHAISWILPRLIGYGRAAEWLFSSRVVLSEEAQTMGLVHVVHPPEEVLEATLAYARRLVDEAAPSRPNGSSRRTCSGLWPSRPTRPAVWWRR